MILSYANKFLSEFTYTSFTRQPSVITAIKHSSIHAIFAGERYADIGR